MLSLRSRLLALGLAWASGLLAACQVADDVHDARGLRRTIIIIGGLVLASFIGFVWHQIQRRRGNLVCVRLAFTRDARWPAPWQDFAAVGARADALGANTPIGRAFRARESALLALGHASMVVLAECEATANPIGPAALAARVAESVGFERGAFANADNAARLAAGSGEMAAASGEMAGGVFYLAFVLGLNRSVRRWQDPTSLHTVKLMLERLADVATPQVTQVELFWSPTLATDTLPRAAVVEVSPKLAPIA